MRPCVSRMLAYANAKKAKLSKLTLTFIMGAKQHRAKVMRMALNRWRSILGTSKRALVKILIKKTQDIVKDCFNTVRIYSQTTTKGNQMSLKMKARVL